MGSGFFAACAWLKVGLYACRERQGGSGRLSRQVLPPLTLGERVGVRGGCSRLPFGSAPWLVCGKRQSGFGRLPAPESLLFAGPRHRRSGGERRSRPEGRRAGCPESREVTKRNGLFNPPTLQARRVEGIGPMLVDTSPYSGHPATYLETEEQSLAALRLPSRCISLPCVQGRVGVGCCCFCALGARCFSRGPSAAVRRGRSGRAAGESTDGLAFSTGQDARPKSPATAHGLSVHGWTESAAAGCRFLLVTSP